MRQKETSLKQHLIDHGERFDFFEAARRFHQMFAQPEVENEPSKVTFHSAVSKSYPIRQISRITKREKSFQANVAVLGCYGHTGILPKHDWDFLASRRAETFTLEFLNLFNHRQLEKFYDAWKKHRIDIAREDKNVGKFRNDKKNDAPTDVMLSYAGFGIEKFKNRHEFPDGVFAGLASYFSRPVRTPESLARAISAQFEIEVEVHQFVENRYTLPECSRTVVGASNGVFHQLGQNVVVGKTVPNFHSRFEVILGPLNTQQLRQLSPFGYRNAFKELLQFLKAFCGTSLDFDLRYLVDKTTVNQTCLGESILGFNCWVLSGPSNEQRNDPMYRFTWGQDK